VSPSRKIRLIEGTGKTSAFNLKNYNFLPFFSDQKPETTVCDVTTILPSDAALTGVSIHCSPRGLRGEQ
jgi:hypothetical protein